MRNGIINVAYREFVFGGHLFALGAACIVKLCSLLLPIHVGWDLVAVAYFIFYPIYLFDYTHGAKHDSITNSVRASHHANGMRKVYAVTILSVAVITYLVLTYSSPLVLVICYSILILGFVYGPYFKQVTRKIVGFKNYFVATVWGLLVPFTYWYGEQAVTIAVVLFAAFVFIRMVGVQILFDVRDMDGDKISGLRTIPVTLGGHREFALLSAINLLSVLLICVGIATRLLPAISLGFIVVLLYAEMYAEQVRKSTKDYRFYLLGAAEPVVWFLAVYLVR